MPTAQHNIQGGWNSYRPSDNGDYYNANCTT